MSRRPSHPLRTFVAADTETTGFFHDDGDRVVEVAFLRFVDGEITERFVSLVHPQRPIPPRVTDIHGITDEMVAKSPTFKRLFSKIVKFVGDDPLVIHNAGFDVPFFETESYLAGKAWPAEIRVYCTLELARSSGLFGWSHRLPDLAHHIGVKQKFHRAEADAYTAGKLLLFLMAKNVAIEPW